MENKDSRCLERTVKEIILPFITFERKNGEIPMTKTKLSTTHQGTEMFRVEFHITSKNGVDSYNAIAKRYLTQEKNGTTEFIRKRMIKNPAEFEYKVLELYNNKGLRVPPLYGYDSKNNILLMGDFGDQTLEKELEFLEKEQRRKNFSYEKTEELVWIVFNELTGFHKTSREIEPEVVKNYPEVTEEFRNFGKKIGGFYYLLTAKEDELRSIEDLKKHEKLKEEAEFINNSRFIIANLKEAQQLIHSDLTTYHTFIFGFDRPKRAGFIDLENLRLRNPAVDYALLAFSPDINLSINTILDIYEANLDKKRFEGLIEPKPNLKKHENKRLLYAGFLSSIRGPAKSREISIRSPLEFKNYSKKHPVYITPEIYAEKLGNIIQFLKTSNRVELKDEEGRALEKLVNSGIVDIIRDAKIYSHEKPAEEKEESSKVDEGCVLQNITKQITKIASSILKKKILKSSQQTLKTKTCSYEL